MFEETDSAMCRASMRGGLVEGQGLPFFGLDVYMEATGHPFWRM